MYRYLSDRAENGIALLPCIYKLTVYHPYDTKHLNTGNMLPSEKHVREMYAPLYLTFTEQAFFFIISIIYLFIYLFIFIIFYFLFILFFFFLKM